MRKRPPPFSAEHRANISASHKGKPHGPMSAEHKAKVSAARKGKGLGPRPPGTAEKISAALTGRMLSKEHIEKMARARRGQKQSPEVIARRSAAMTGKKRKPYKKWSEETKARVSASRRARAKPLDWIVPEFPPVIGTDLVGALSAIRANGKRFYVYVLRRPDGSPFYVGKGCGDRIAEHELDSKRESSCLYRHRIIRCAMREGVGIGYEIAGFYDDESLAFAEESRLIEMYGRRDQRRGPLTNNTNGGEGASNPSAETIAKRVIGLKAAMSDPQRKALCVSAMHRDKEKRVAGLRLALQTESYKTKRAAVMKAKWQDPEFRAKTVTAMHASHNAEWKARHAEGVARCQADPEHHRRREEGKRRARMLSDVGVGNAA